MPMAASRSAGSIYPCSSIYWRTTWRRLLLFSGWEMGLYRDGFEVIAASTVHSARFSSETSLPKYRSAAVFTPSVLFPRLMVFR